MRLIKLSWNYPRQATLNFCYQNLAFCSCEVIHIIPISCTAFGPTFTISTSFKMNINSILLTKKFPGDNIIEVCCFCISYSVAETIAPVWSRALSDPQLDLVSQSSGGLGRSDPQLDLVSQSSGSIGRSDPQLGLVSQSSGSLGRSDPKLGLVSQSSGSIGRSNPQLGLVSPSSGSLGRSDPQLGLVSLPSGGLGRHLLRKFGINNVVDGWGDQ